MKPLRVQDQVSLGFVRCLELCLQGMSYRLFRSLITVSIIALAVTFLVHMTAYGLIAQNTKRLAFQELQDSRLLGEWMTRLTTPDQEGVILGILDNAKADSGRLTEYQQWSGATEDDLVQRGVTARQLVRAWDYLEKLPAATRVALLSGLDASDPLELTAELADQQQDDLFRVHLKQLRIRPPLDNLGTFENLVHRDAPPLAALVGRIRDGQSHGIARIGAAYPGRDPLSLLAAPPAGLAEKLTDAGFYLTTPTLDYLSALAQNASDAERIQVFLNNVQLKNALAQRMKLSLDKIDLTALLDWLDSQGRAAWLAGELSGLPGAGGFTSDRLFSLASFERRQASLEKVAGDQVPSERTGILALPSETLWLIGVSFLVCVVGVANAMLMSVTERFTEIATMKCLGAIDGFVMEIFFIEAILLGVLGGLIGVLAGVALAVFRCLMEFGAFSLTAIPTGDLIGCALAAWGAGIALAGAAAIGPVAVAARLAPMEAMRVE